MFQNSKFTFEPENLSKQTTIKNDFQNINIYFDFRAENLPEKSTVSLIFDEATNFEKLKIAVTIENELELIIKLTNDQIFSETTISADGTIAYYNLNHPIKEIKFSCQKNRNKEKNGTIKITFM